MKIKTVAYRFVFLLVVLFLFSNAIRSQNNDSLKNILADRLPDTTYCKAALDLSWNYMYTDIDTAVYYAGLALDAAGKTKSTLYTLNALNTLGVCYIVKGDYYTAQSYLQKAKEKGTELMKQDSSSQFYKRRFLAVLTNLGNVHYHLGEYDKAVSHYLSALSLAEKIDAHDIITTIISNLGATYKDLHNYKKALEYQYKALDYSKKSGDLYSIGQALTNLGSVYSEIQIYDSAYHYFMKSIKIDEQANMDYQLVANCINLGTVLQNLGKQDSSYYYYKKGLRLAKKLKAPEALINSTYLLGQYFVKTQQYDSAGFYLKKSLELAEKTGTMRFVMLANDDLAALYQKQNNYKKALEYYVAGRVAADSLFNAEKDKRIADMEAKYKVREKENQIRFLTEKNRLLDDNFFKTKIILGSVLIILLLALVLLMVLFRNYRLKKETEQRKLQQENERKLINAIVKTEYNERRRFSSDLHDGLGVLLSALKLYINEIKNLSGEKREQIIDKSNKLLDEAIQNARNISNNIMPAALKSHGLLAALHSFADKINAAGKIKVQIKSVNFDKRLNEVLELTLFRVLTEMTNNTLKHAEATEIQIDFVKKGETLFISYRDNGKGFDYEAVKRSRKTGQGLDNIISRINTIGGKCGMESREGKGFTATIEIEL